ncbi:unnamed protein product [Pedinophyceae sp. YPF-701]|nr:unnamed protein product [Pedinophyceae sp. YPF-701]
MPAAGGGQAAPGPGHGGECSSPADPGVILDSVRALVRRRVDVERGRSDAPEWMRGASASAPLQDRLTVLLTTSATRSNPSTALIEAVLGTFPFCPGLEQCRLVVVCDGCNVKQDHEIQGRGVKALYRGGMVPGEQGLSDYAEYKTRLRRICGDAGRFPGGAAVVELDTRHGFGLAVRAGLAHVSTPYVMVVQHDRNFARPFDVAGLVDAVAADAAIKMAALLNTSMADHARRVHGRIGGTMPVSPAEWFAWAGAERRVPAAAHLRFRPLAYWLDSTHVCPTEHYRSFVLGGGSGPEGKIKRGGFIEDKLGQLQIKELRRDGPGSHARHGTYIVDDGREPEDVLARHFDGGAFELGNGYKHFPGSLWSPDAAFCGPCRGLRDAVVAQSGFATGARGRGGERGGAADAGSSDDEAPGGAGAAGGACGGGEGLCVGCGGRLECAQAC